MVESTALQLAVKKAGHWVVTLVGQKVAQKAGLMADNLDEWKVALRAENWVVLRVALTAEKKVVHWVASMELKRVVQTVQQKGDCSVRYLVTTRGQHLVGSMAEN